MSLSLEDLQKRIAAGEDLAAIGRLLISPTEQGLLRCCAVVRTFDEELVDNYFRPQVPEADKDSVKFSDLTSNDFVQRVPRTKGVYSLQPASQKKYYDSWWEGPDGNILFPRHEVPQELRQLSTKLLAHYTALGDDAKLDALAQQVFVDKKKACDLFDELYQAADAAFDLARCRDIINVPKGFEKVLGPELSKALNDRDRYLQSRSLWANEYYQTVNYYERRKLSTELESFLTANSKPDPAKKWILHLHAPGGLGKTMFIRWLIARRSVPLPHTIPCARIDFDFENRNTSSEHRWRLFLKMARQLEVQIPGNYFRSLISKFTDYERILEHQQTQQTTSPTPTQLPPRDKLEEEMLYLFGNAFKDAKLQEPVILIFDTLEEVILYHANDLLEIVQQVDTLRKPSPTTLLNVVLVLSGRYDLSKVGPEEVTRLPEFSAKFDDFMNTVRVEPFEKGEAIGFLQLRGLTKDRPLDLVFERSEGNPFKLALFADILLDDPAINEETIRSYPSADLLYLIERVLARIPNKTLHWLLRYGVVQRKLTLTFAKDVLKKHLQNAISGVNSDDDPSRYELLSKKVQETVREKKILVKNISAPGQDLNMDKLWAELQNYAGRFGWVTIEASDPFTAGFHTDVLNPMRRWLEKEPVYKQLHQDAITYFENKAQTEPQNWSKWMCNAVYHKFQLEGAQAANYWHQLIAKEEQNPARRRDLASEVIESDYIDENLKPRLLLDGSEIITRATLAIAYYELARANVSLAQAQHAPAGDKLWLDADSDLQKCERLDQQLSQPALPPSSLASVRAAILLIKGNTDAAISILQEALKQEPDGSVRPGLEITLADALNSIGDYQNAISHLESSLRMMPQLGFASHLAIPTRRNLARFHCNQADLEAGAAELQKALNLVSEDDEKTRAELLNDLTDLYFEMGQFSRAQATFEEVNSLRTGSNSVITQQRYLNQKARFLMAVGNPQRAFLDFDVRTITVQDLAATEDIENARNALTELLTQEAEQKGTLHRMLFEVEAARGAFESARGRWHELGNSKAVKRCMLKKAELFLNAREIHQASSILDEISRLSIAYDGEQWLEENLILLGIMHFTEDEKGSKSILANLEKRGVAEKWRPDLLAKLKLRTGARTFSPNNCEAVNKFFVDLTKVLKQIRPASARMLLLDSLSGYPSYKEIGYHVAQELVDLFPLNRSDDSFSVHAPRLAELLRVVGRKDQAVALLRDLINSEEITSFLRRRALLALARTSPQRVTLDDLRKLEDTFLQDYKSFPVLCAATLIELVERSFATRKSSDRLLDQAAELLKADRRDSQWMARLLALRGRLTIKDQKKKALEQLTRSIVIHESLGNSRGATTLKRLVAKETNSPEPFLDLNVLTVHPQAKTTIHIEDKWHESLTINTTLPGEEVTTRHVPIEPDSVLDRLLAFDTYENYSFKFLRAFDTDWIRTCRELGSILLDKKQTQRLQAVAGKDKQKPALSLMIDALQLSSAPWEMMVLPSQADGPASISPEVSCFYRALLQPSYGAVRDVTWLQTVLTQLGIRELEADGIFGPMTTAALRGFQRNQGIPDHGNLDGLTRRKLKQAVLAKEARKRPRVLLLRPGIERQRATSRGHEVYGFSIEDWYRKHNFKDVVVVEDPHVAQLEKILSDSEFDVVHIFPTMEESTSIGIYLDFGSGGTGVVPSKSSKKASANRSSAAASGEVQFLTLSAFAELMQRQQRRTPTRPLLILDVLEPAGQTELFTQLFLRNAFATQLYQHGVFESIIATGLTPLGLQKDLKKDMFDTLISAIGAFESVGETVNRLRRLADLGSYSQLAPGSDHPGLLRDPSGGHYLATVVVTAGIALFTQDPET